MTSGIGALGIDRPGDQLDKGLQQHLLLIDQTLGIQGHGRGGRQRLDERHQLRTQFVLLFIDQQSQYAEQIAGPALERQHPQRDGFVDVAEQRQVGLQLFGRQRARLTCAHGPHHRVTMSHGQFDSVVRIPLQQTTPPACTRQRDMAGIGIGQVDQATFGIGNFLHFPQQMGQQALEVRFTRQCNRQLKEAVNRAFHVAHGTGQIDNLGNLRLDLDRIIEVKTLDLLRLGGQCVQWL